MRVCRVCSVLCAFLAGVLLYGQSEETFNANQRINRIRELGKKDARVIPTLAENLSDPNRDIRIEAVKAIVKLDTEASLGPLVKATHDNDPEVQIRATDGIVNYYVPGYVAKGSLTGPLTRGVRQVKAFFGVRNDQVIDPDVAVRPDVQDAIAAEVRGGASDDARANAARAAGILRDRTAVPMLEDALHVRDSEQIIECLIALEKIRDPSAGAKVASAANDLDERVQTTALETLGVLHCLTCAPDVRTALSNARNARVRRAALETLAMLAIPGDRTTFQQYAPDKDAEVRAAALEGLGRIREPEDFPTLEAAYNEKDADWKVHLAAAFAMVDQGKVDTGEFSPLSYLWESVENKARASVAQTYLDELARRDDVRQALFTLAPNSTKDQKVALCAILANSRAPDAIPTLNTLSKDIDSDVSLAAARALRIVQGRQS
ncbi:MAG: HEAT repeat domain-containing protein [Acidobacteriaceae bacterium]|nr:HEAT repeat domain-containing protein [Acidobacteriaceae bacterium]